MAAPLEPELEAGLRRLKLRRVRELAPELCQTARTQRWRPEELLQTLVREEIAAREASNLARRLKAARFPTPKTLQGFDPAASELSAATFSFLSSLEWLSRRENLCLAGPAGTGKSHLGAALARAACEAGSRVRFLAADELTEELHRGLADNSVGKLVGSLLRNDLVAIDDLGFTAMDRTAAEHLFRFVAAAYEKRSLIVTTNVAFERWTAFLPEETVATAILDRLLHHCHVIRLSGESYRLREARKVVTPA
jgi:DNA replication protein DnaC